MVSLNRERFVIRSKIMATWDELRNEPLDAKFHRIELENYCRAIYGGVGWPTRNPGFAVVLAISRPLVNQGKYREICLVSEYESYYVDELLRHCQQLDVQWDVDRWLGDEGNDAAMEILHKMNKKANRHLDLATPYLLNMDGEGHKMCPMYRHILDASKELSDKKRLFLKTGQVDTYLHGIDFSNITELEGTLPAIEALGYALDEMLRDMEIPPLSLLPTRTGEVVSDPRYRPKTVDDLAYSGAVDDIDDYDDFDEDAWYRTS